MTHVLAVLEPDDPRDGVAEVAAAMAEVIGADVREVVVDRTRPDADAAAEVVRAVAAPSVEVAVLSAAAAHLDLAWQVVGTSRKPIVLMPPDGTRPRAIGRALIPLDGRPESAAAVGQSMSLLARAGVDLIAVHVMDLETAPRFWDHAGHADEAWRQEFLARYCPEPDVRLQLRTGIPGASILDAAAAEDVDLIALGWSQQLTAGRAATVRGIVDAARVPVLLVPLGSAG